MYFDNLKQRTSYPYMGQQLFNTVRLSYPRNLELDNEALCISNRGTLLSIAYVKQTHDVALCGGV